MKIKRIDSDMKEDFIWDLTDVSQESNSEWLIGQVNVTGTQQVDINCGKKDFNSWVSW